MALASYNDLIAAIADWAKRSDLGARLQDFVTLAESRIKPLIHARLLEQTVDLPVLAGAKSTPSPIGIQEPLALWRMDNSNWIELTQVDVVDLPFSELAARPYYYGIDGANIAFAAPLDANYSFKLRYSPLYSLSPTNQTNEVMTKYPDVYLYSSLLEAAIWSRDDQAGNVWAARFNEAVKRANRQEARANKNVNLVSDLPAVMRTSFNIYRGY